MEYESWPILSDSSQGYHACVSFLAHVGRKARGGLDGGLCLGRQIRMFISAFLHFPFEYGDGEIGAVPNCLILEPGYLDPKAAWRSVHGSLTGVAIRSELN